MGWKVNPSLQPSVEEGASLGYWEIAITILEQSFFKSETRNNKKIKMKLKINALLGQITIARRELLVNDD